ncbi:hypothetical protein F8B43_3287 [Methylorubrum populi]|uniref:Uncharacterized protein n=1 Tax=Methylorubrum populi TaxID=223967 RepID=A0A833J6Q9_9HYPH|nr:hypothetical protein F8B43_3287 [Methylorubrum populi]
MPEHHRCPGRRFIFSSRVWWGASCRNRPPTRGLKPRLPQPALARIALAIAGLSARSDVTSIT